MSTTGHLEVTLNNLRFDNYLPRRGDGKLDFRITISVLPNLLSENYSDKHKTKIYKGHVTNEPYIFDLSLDKTNEDDNTFKTIFKLEKDEGVHKFGKNQFLQIILHDHSRTRINKMFLGMLFVPINDIEEKKSINKPIEEKFREIDESVKGSNDIFKELQKRSSKFAADINKYVSKERTASRASLTPIKDKTKETSVPRSTSDAKIGNNI